MISCATKAFEISFVFETLLINAKFRNENTKGATSKTRELLKQI